MYLFLPAQKVSNRFKMILLLARFPSITSILLILIIPSSTGGNPRNLFAFLSSVKTEEGKKEETKYFSFLHYYPDFVSLPSVKPEEEKWGRNKKILFFSILLLLLLSRLIPPEVSALISSPKAFEKARASLGRGTDLLITITLARPCVFGS